MKRLHYQLKYHIIFRKWYNMKFSYQPLESHARKADPDSLDFFLIERYVLFSLKSGQLHYQRVHHLPYHLKEVAVNAFETNLYHSRKINS